MGAEYTKAQAKASAKWKAKQSAITVYLDAEQREKWKAKASEEGLSVNQWAKRIVEDYMKES